MPRFIAVTLGSAREAQRWYLKTTHGGSYSALEGIQVITIIFDPQSQGCCCNKHLNFSRMSVNSHLGSWGVHLFMVAHFFPD